MIALVRLLIIILVLQTLAYVVALRLARARARRRLEQEYEEGGLDREKDDYIEAGMIEYETSLRRGLLYAIYVVPLAMVAFLVYATNFM